MSQEFIIYTRWLAVELRKRGFKILRTEINQFHPQFDTYVFENSIDFQATLSELTNRADK